MGPGVDPAGSTPRPDAGSPGPCFVISIADRTEAQAQKVWALQQDVRWYVLSDTADLTPTRLAADVATLLAPIARWDVDRCGEVIAPNVPSGPPGADGRPSTSSSLVSHRIGAAARCPS